MKSRLRPKLNYSNAIATIALFVALGGAAVAAGLPKNSVGPKQLKRGAVTTAKLRKAAVRSGKLAPKSVIVGKLGPGAVLPGNIVNGGVNSNKLANGAVIARSIKNNVVTTNKLNNKAVTSEKLAANAVGTANLLNGSVTLGKLADDVAPLLGTLKTGQTLRGVFDLGGGGTNTAVGDEAHGGVSFQFPLLNAPAVSVLKEGETSANCAGLGGGQTPAATGGNLCIYITKAENLEEGTLTAENNTRLGFGLLVKAKEAGKPVYAYGQWAVTAP